MSLEQDWQALAKHVRARRETLRLPIDLSRHGGPAEMTVRRIESGETDSIRPRTKTLLEQVLEWETGLVDKILDGTATEEELTGTTDAEDWNVLASAVRRKRELLGLRQGDLESRGGPSNGTVRNIEQAARQKYATRTFTQLERALEWIPGTVARILSGDAASEGFAAQPSSRPARPDRVDVMGAPCRTVSIQDVDGHGVLLNYADRVEVDAIPVAVSGIVRHPNGRVVVTFDEVDDSHE